MRVIKKETNLLKQSLRSSMYMNCNEHVYITAQKFLALLCNQYFNQMHNISLLGMKAYFARVYVHPQGVIFPSKQNIITQKRLMSSTPSTQNLNTITQIFVCVSDRYLIDFNGSLRLCLSLFMHIRLTQPLVYTWKVFKQNINRNCVSYTCSMCMDGMDWVKLKYIAHKRIGTMQYIDLQTVCFWLNMCREPMQTRPSYARNLRKIPSVYICYVTKPSVKRSLTVPFNGLTSEALASDRTTRAPITETDEVSYYNFL